MFPVLATLYLIVGAILLAFTLVALAGEPDGPGRSVLLPMGIAISLFWPIVLAYLVFVATCAGLHWCAERIGLR